ncbi:probable glutathione S-transferase parA [Hibiscus syriacus]|uniref:probable glutathione S-transferase parA n=1 Tax=Hibiscus syriacus TaxID=106335 RepID=UPI0019243F3C|nr:probable glutathione S-transferase parA [Hibiscus syriacus]
MMMLHIHGRQWEGKDPNGHHRDWQLLIKILGYRQLYPSSDVLTVPVEIYGIGRRVWKGKEDQEEAKEELMEYLKTLEEELGNKLYFGGETIGLVDVALVPFTPWFYTYETCGNFSIEAGCPKLVAWANRCKQNHQSVANALPHPHQIYDYLVQLKKGLGLA